MRRCTQAPPVARHSAHPSTASGSSVILIVSRWVHRAMTVVSGSVLAEREPHREGGAARGGVEGQGAVVPDDDAARRGQAEPGSLADVLGGEEGIEDLVAEAGPDAGAVVGDLDDGAVAVAARRDGDRAAVAERVDR